MSDRVAAGKRLAVFGTIRRWFAERDRSIMKLVVGLGNPGRRYEGTRHNIGYMVLAELAKRHGLGRAKSKFQGEVMEANIGGEKVLLLSPTTYMNRSGDSVLAAKEYYQLAPEDVFVICDDINLPVGRLRCRARGSCGGQKGLRNIVDRLRTQSVARLRIGVGEVPERWNAADYVLGKFAKDEQPEIERAIARAANAVEVWVGEGVEPCMNKFNAAS